MHFPKKKKKLHIRKTGGYPTIQKLADCLCQFLQVLYYSWGTPRSSLIQVYPLKTEEIEIKKRKYVFKKYSNVHFQNMRNCSAQAKFLSERRFRYISKRKDDVMVLAWGIRIPARILCWYSSFALQFIPAILRWFILCSG